MATECKKKKEKKRNIKMSLHFLDQKEVRLPAWFLFNNVRKYHNQIKLIKEIVNLPGHLSFSHIIE